MADTASTVSNGVRRIIDSGSKAMRRNKNRDSIDTVQQDSIDTVQQDDTSTMIQQDVTSMTVNTPSISTRDGGNSGNNTAREYGVMDVLRDASFLLELGSQTPQFEMNSTNEFSPVHDQNLSPTQSADLSKVNLSSPPRLNPSGNNSVTVTGMDLLDAQDASANNDSVVGTHIPAPSPRRSTQSPVTHQLQQTLRNDAREQVSGYNYSSPARSSGGGDGASAFSTFDTNNPTIVETVQKGNSDDGDGWPEGEGLAGGSANEVQVDLIPRTSGAPDETGTAYDSGLRTLAVDTTENLVIDTNDPGRADFVISVGALGNASGTPLDGSHNMSFRENAIDGRQAIDENNSNDGMAVYSGSDSSTSYATPSGYDPRDPEVLASLLTRPPMPSTCSPTSTIQLNEQVVVTKYSQGGVTSTTTGNLGGADNNRPSSSLPGGDALRQHANAGSNSNSSGTPSGTTNGSPNSGDSNGGNGNDNQGRTSNGNDPQDSGPNANDLNKILLEYTTIGGPLQHWGIQGTIRAKDLVQFSGFRDPQTYQWVLQSKRQLIRPEIID